MSRITEPIVLAVGNQYTVSSYSGASLQIDTITSSEGVTLSFEGTIEESLGWVPVRVRRMGNEKWETSTRIYSGTIVEVELTNVTKIRVSQLATQATVDAEAAWLSRSFNPSHLVAAPNENDIRAAAERVNELGGGIVEILPGLVTLTSPLPLYDGVRYKGQLGDMTFTTIPDSTWTLDPTTSTVLQGDGTFNAFEHNAVGTDTLPVSQVDFSNEMITNWGLEDLAFDSFACAVQVGSRNKGGGFFFHIRNLLIKNTYEWGFRLTNSMHYEVERIKAVDTWRGGVGLVEGNCPDTILQTGNCFIRHIFGCPNGDASGNTAKQRRLAKGIEFHANHTGGGLGILNEVHAYGIQVNMFNRAGLSVTATFTSGNANIGVPDSSEYAVGMPVRFTTTPATGFSTNKVYVVRAVGTGTIQLALDRSGSIITPSSSTTATMVCNGMPAMAVMGLTASSRVSNSDFTALDLEGGYGAGLYTDRPGTTKFVVNQFGSLGNNVDIVARGASNCYYESLNTAVTDIDSTSSASFYAGRQTMLDRPGKGWGYETERNVHIFSMGGSGITALRMTPGDGFRMATNAGFGFQTVSRTTTLTMTNNHFGLIVISGTTSGQNITLPVTSSSTGETGNSGSIAIIENRSNQNWTIQTQSSQTFNGVAGKTSFVLPAGQSAIVTSDGTGYSAILGAALP